MADDRRAVRRILKVGNFTAEVSIPVMRGGGVAMATVEWSPRVPESLSAAEQATYEAELARALAGAMGVEP